MKKKFIYQRLLFQLVKLAIVQVLFLLAFTSNTLATKIEGQELLKLKVTVSIKGIKLKEALNEIENVAKIKFSYNSRILEMNQKVTIVATNELLSSILNRILKPLGIDFMQVSKRIVLKKEEFKQAFDALTPITPSDLNIIISGKVTDEKEEPLPGVNVVIKGTQHGTTTDVEGNYKITVDNTNSLLVFTYIGYNTQEVVIGNRDKIDIKMRAVDKSLDEVVVIGYGTQSKAKIIGSIAKVDATAFKDIPLTSFEQGIAGRLTGVNIIQGTGSPGSAASIQIRGVGTITAGVNPLLVIDGLPTDNLNISDINPNDIESLQVFKDASAASIYGSRASNGVILVTTKKGATGKTSFNFNMYSGSQEVTKTYQMADAYQWASFQVDTYRQRGAWTDNYVPNLYQPYLTGTPDLVNTDWQKEIFRKASIQSYQLALSGSQKKINYYFSGEFFNQEGVVIGSNFKRYSFRTNLESVLFDKEESFFIKNIKFGINIAPSFTNKQAISESHHNNDGVILTSLYAYPNFPAYNGDGSPALSQQLLFRQNQANNNGAGFENPVAVALLRDNPINGSRLIGTTYLDVELIKGLNFKTLIGTNYFNEQNNLYRPSILGKRNQPAPTVATATSSTARIFNWVNENTLTYSTTLQSNHHIDLLAGYTIQHETIFSNTLSGQGFASDEIHTLNAASQITSGNSYQEEWFLVSYLGRLNYDFKDKYLLSIATRRDGSSRFGDFTKFGNFPSISIGWRVNRESFFESFRKSISDLKVRLSYGRTGNNQIPNYGSIALLTNANYIYSNAIVNGLAPNTAPNKNLSWENKEQFDFGLDFGIFNNKVTFTGDYYYSITNGLLLNVPVPSQSGYTTSLQNIGKVRNKGVELSLATNNIHLGPVTWSSSFNISMNRNKVLALGDGQDRIISKQHITKIGEPIGQFYLYNIIGVFNTQDEINSKPHLSTDKPGDYIYEDINNDGKIDGNDRKVMGSVFPKFIYGFTNTFQIKNFDLNVVVQGSQGNKLFNFTRFFLIERGDFANVLAERVTGAWKSPNEPGTGYARAGSNDTYLPQSNKLLEDASYLRIRSLTLGYTLPSTVSKKLYIEKARIYFSSLNPFTITKYTGYNPEVNATIGAALDASGGPLQPGIDWGNYPTARSFNIGLNLAF